MFDPLILTPAAAARETKPAEAGVRIPVRFTFSDGSVHHTTTTEASMDGLSAPGPKGVDLKGRTLAFLSLIDDQQIVDFPAHLVDTGGGAIRAQFLPMSMAKRRRLVAIVMGRTDDWRPGDAALSAQRALAAAPDRAPSAPRGGDRGSAGMAAKD